MMLSGASFGCSVRPLMSSFLGNYVSNSLGMSERQGVISLRQKFDLQRALKIPGQITDREMKAIVEIANTVPEGGIIVETGSLYGKSTYCWAAGAPQAVVYAIDPFERAQWIIDYVERPGRVDIPFSERAFRHYTDGLGNIETIVGYSPDCALDWNEQIDVYFDDSVHEDPGFTRNVDFWLQFLKPGGVFCGHDFRHDRTDITRTAIQKSSEWSSELHVVDNFFWIRKYS